MNGYFNTFLNLDQSIGKLLEDEHNSLEIKQSAASLKESVKPCIEELMQSATRLKRLVVVASDKLYHAENVWLSKPRITEAGKQEIWEHLGEVSGHHFKIRLLGSQCQREAVTQAEKSWEEVFERLEKNWFTDAKGQRKKGVGWSEKEGFLIGIRYEFKYFYNQRINFLLKRNLNPVYQEVKRSSLETFPSHIRILDQHTKSELSRKVDLIVNEIENKFQNPAEYISNQSKGLKESAGSALEALLNKSWGIFTGKRLISLKRMLLPKLVILSQEFVRTELS